ncbi:MAG: zinc-binding alcohol dehydrogenase family protein [Deltaproteobacteria bacterium]|nr:MAG: zinc-binding alcohol dehydrogenase family protein [Deltaproteobacteria bacterium]
MKAMRITKLGPVKQGSNPLEKCEIDVPKKTEGEVLVKVTACGVCHTELDEIEGRAPPPRLPVTPGHQIVGTVVEGTERFRPGERVGVAWFFSSCGRCDFCQKGLVNLCPDFRATGRDADGGYAEYAAAPEGAVYNIPDVFTDTEAAPLLCAGAVGYRALKLCDLSDGEALGFTGFGASAHVVLQAARHLYPNSRMLVFARNPAQRKLALELGASWAGDIGQQPPVAPDAIIDTTPVWRPVLEGLKALGPGGRMVINAIRKESKDSELLSTLDYTSQLWMEKQVRSVANVTPADVREFLEIAARAGLKPATTIYPLSEANRALVDLACHRASGALVLVP